MTVKDEIEQLKKEKNAIILAHYYVRPEVQEIADYIGDSFYLSKIAAKSDAETIVFCGVYFMGESAKILSPEKRVLLPDITADCAMAHMADPERIRQMRETYEDLAVVCYINSTAELKRYADVCVTSANALGIIRKLPNRNIYFIPDQNLAHFAADQIPEKNFIFNEGYCPCSPADPDRTGQEGEGGSSRSSGACASGVFRRGAGTCRRYRQYFRYH